MSTETSPESSTSPRAIDTSVMPMIHTYYRRELRLAPGLIRAVADGDTRRARVVADHLDVVGRHLHHHHTLEDRMLWPVLLQRVPEELAPIVNLMESQHQVVDRLQDEIAEVMPAWQTHARAADRDRLAELHDSLYVNLVEHLDAEEARLLPIAARTLTQAEWDEMGEEGRDGTPRKELALTFGMFAYEGDPEVVDGMLAKAPLPVRVIVPRLARRAFRRHAVAVYGTVMP